MTRARALELCKKEGLERFSKAFRILPGSIRTLPNYEGAANIVSSCQTPEGCAFLRISFRQDRGEAALRSELDFLAYLSDGGLRVAKPIPAADGSTLVAERSDEGMLYAALFPKADGYFLHERGYALPEGSSLETFLTSFGETVGRFHSLAQAYRPKDKPKRFDWIERHRRQVDELFRAEESPLREGILRALDRFSKLPAEDSWFGLAHNDIGIMNMTILDDPRCPITLIDFDDCGYNRFGYDIASAWEIITGWLWNQPDPIRRRERMTMLFAKFIEAYDSARRLPEGYLESMQIFLNAQAVENVLESLRVEMEKKGRLDMDGECRWFARCLIEDIPDLGVFLDDYDVENPFFLKKQAKR